MVTLPLERVVCLTMLWGGIVNCHGIVIEIIPARTNRQVFHSRIANFDCEETNLEIDLSLVVQIVMRGVIVALIF